MVPCDEPPEYFHVGGVLQSVDPRCKTVEVVRTMLFESEVECDLMFSPQRSITSNEIDGGTKKIVQNQTSALYG